VTITSPEGKVIWERTIKNSSAELTLDKTLKPGLYYVEIRKGDEKTVKRIVVK
jgi:hypothetical protein